MRRKGLDTHNKKRLMRSLYEHNKQVDLQMKLEAGMCVDCGLVVTPTNAVGFDWDHIDRNSKVREVSKFRNGSTLRMLEEIAKCVLRCAPCHRVKTKENNENQTVNAPCDTEQLTLF
jgi:hypothetical protein